LILSAAATIVFEAMRRRTPITLVSGLGALAFATRIR
jgi:hypothetical protein